MGTINWQPPTGLNSKPGSSWIVSQKTRDPLEAVNGFVEPSLKTSHQGQYVHRHTIVQDLQNVVPVRTANVSDRDGGASCRHNSTSLWTTYMFGTNRQFGTPTSEDKRALWATLVPGTTPNLNTREAQKLEEFIMHFQDINITKSDNCGKTESINASTLVMPIQSVCLLHSCCPVRLRQMRHWKIWKWKWKGW
jgi:hypothetical protein